MRRTVRILGLALMWACCYLLGLAFVAYLTDGIYVDLNLAGTAAWEECDDCGAFMSNEAWFWVKIVAGAYTASWLVLGAYLVRRVRRRDGTPRALATPVAGGNS